jgi:hypothetical protein
MIVWVLGGRSRCRGKHAEASAATITACSVNKPSTRHDLRIAVLKCDFGLGIVRKGFPESRLSYSAAQIEALNYADPAADRDRLLNLKPPGYLGEFLASERRISRK